MRQMVFVAAPRSPTTTLDRQSGSSRQAIRFAVQGMVAEGHDLVVVAEAESMGVLPR